MTHPLFNLFVQKQRGELILSNSEAKLAASFRFQSQSQHEPESNSMFILLNVTIVSYVPFNNNNNKKPHKTLCEKIFYVWLSKNNCKPVWFYLKTTKEKEPFWMFYLTCHQTPWMGFAQWPHWYFLFVFCFVLDCHRFQRSQVQARNRQNKQCLEKKKKTLPCSEVSGHKNKTATEVFSDMSVKGGSSAGICL